MVFYYRQSSGRVIPHEDVVTQVVVLLVADELVLGAECAIGQLLHGHFAQI